MTFELLAQKPEEIELLYQDLLINVTDFFRDTEAFQFLESSILPRLLSGKAPGETLRIWVVACATGEEVYSLAMLLFELHKSLKLDNLIDYVNHLNPFEEMRIDEWNE
jgi:two-component system CheB/CheR fusion protein